MAINELEWMKTFGDNLRDILIDARMTQTELADEIGVTQAAVSKYIKGQVMPSAKVLSNIFHVLDVDVYDILYFGDKVV